MKHRVLLAAAALAVASLVAPAAHAAPVTITFGLSAAAHAPTDAACRLSVPSGANGVQVLAAAKSARCIESYQTETDPAWGTYVTCINRVCGAPPEALWLTYWITYINGSPAQTGVDDYRARSGDAIVWSYESWLACLVRPC